IYTILKDPIYTGFFYYGSEKYELDRSLPRLITEQQREKVLQTLSKKNIPKVQHHKALYSGFIRSDEGDAIGPDFKFQLICDCKHKFAYRDKTHCPNCNKEIDQLENPKYLSKSYYFNNRKKKAKLPYKSIEEATIDSKVMGYIAENLTFSNDLLDWSKKYIHELKDKEVSESILISKDKEKRNEDFEIKKRKIREMLRDSKITDEEYSEDLIALKREYADTQEEVVVSNWYQEMVGITDIIEKINDVIENGTFEAKRNILSQLGSNLTWNDEKLSIHSKESINTLIEGIKRIKLEFPKFEPRSYVAIQGLNEKNEPIDPIFSRMLPRLDSNQRPIAYIYSHITVGMDYIITILITREGAKRFRRYKNRSTPKRDSL
ncbi:MAG: hypothetical protein KBB91_01530, partial [Candidatus Pacebacteria bacterium]|nr:hypothetical protein [Candidatus Paceibacterota bacterium]